MQEVPSWAIGCVNKHGFDAIRVMLSLIETGLKYGQVSSNDIPLSVRDKFEQPKVIGSVMKIAMTNCGFMQKTIIQGSKTYYLMEKSVFKKTHGRLVSVWELVSHSKARKVHYDLMDVIHNIPQEQTGELF